MHPNHSLLLCGVHCSSDIRIVVVFNTVYMKWKFIHCKPAQKMQKKLGGIEIF